MGVIKVGAVGALAFLDCFGHNPIAKDPDRGFVPYLKIPSQIRI